MIDNPHCLQLSDWSRDDIEYVMADAERLLSEPQLEQVLLNQTVATLFFEPSTRTRLSFELAAKRLGADIAYLPINQSSVQKGETLLDTIRTLHAMACRIFVIRHSEAHYWETILGELPDDVRLINAGDGQHAHPTQGLLDMLTIARAKGDIAKCSIAIVGNSRHSRVAHSDIVALKALGCRDIRLIGPAALTMDAGDIEHVTNEEDMTEGLQDCDVVIMLRVQRERLSAETLFNPDDYIKNYCLTEERLNFAKPDAIVLHPGPMNREVEIASNVADGERSLIWQQIRHGVAIRMALMRELSGR